MKSRSRRSFLFLRICSGTNFGHCVLDRFLVICLWLLGEFLVFFGSLDSVLWGRSGCSEKSRGSG